MLQGVSMCTFVPVKQVIEALNKMARMSGARSVSICTFAVVKQAKSASVFVLFALVNLVK